MKRLDWTKAKKFKVSEEKYEDGKIMKNGRLIKKPKDSLAARAAFVERQWLKKIGREKV